MFVLSFSTLALVVSSSALVIPRSSNSSDNSIGINCQKDAPQGWLTSILESYEEYHIRYLALDCEGQHNTSFFQSCCHPHLKTQLLSDSPSECIPSAQAVAAVCNATTTSTESAVTSTEVATTTESTTRTTSTSTESTLTSTESTSTSTESTTPTTSTTLTTTTHSSTHQPASSSTQKPTSPIKSASSSLASSVASAVQVFTGGIATFFYQKGNAGACGAVHSDQDFIAAIDQQRYGNSGEESSLCGQQVIITNTDNGKTVTVTIVDDCPTCLSENSIDLSVAAFEQIGTQEEGEVPIKWSFVN